MEIAKREDNTFFFLNEERGYTSVIYLFLLKTDWPK